MPDHHKPERNMFCLTWLVDSVPPRPPKHRSLLRGQPKKHTLPLADCWALRKISWNFVTGTRGEGQTVIAKERMELSVEACEWFYPPWIALAKESLLHMAVPKNCKFNGVAHCQGIYTTHMKDVATFSKNIQYIFVGPSI